MTAHSPGPPALGVSPVLRQGLAPAPRRPRRKSRVLSTPAVIPPSVVARTGTRAMGMSFHVRPAGPPSVALSVRAADRAVGAHGIVRAWRFRPAPDASDGLRICDAIGPRRLGTRRFPEPVTGTGVATSDVIARVAAIAEAVERYAFWSSTAPRVTRACQAELDGAALPVSAFALPATDQYERSPDLRLPAPGQEIDWTWGYSMSAGRLVLLPAVFAMPASSRRPPNNYLPGVTTTGVACHVEPERAVLSGLYEVVERDALMLHWLHGCQPEVLDTIDDGLRTTVLAPAFGTDDFTAVYLDLSSDSGIPVVGCACFTDDTDLPAAAFGSAARLDRQAAAAKAAMEVAQTVSALRMTGYTSRTPPIALARSIEDRARHYASAHGARRLRAFAASNVVAERRQAVPPVHGVHAELTRSIDLLAARGLDVVVSDLTTADVAECGFSVFRTVVPGMLDIPADIRMPPLGASRLHEHARTCTCPPSGLAPDGSWNLDPCPLA